MMQTYKMGSEARTGVQGKCHVVSYQRQKPEPKRNRGLQGKTEKRSRLERKETAREVLSRTSADVAASLVQSPHSCVREFRAVLEPFMETEVKDVLC